MIEVGKQLGDYTLIEQVDKGPLGVNFLAQHRFMRRSFLLKVLPQDLCKDQNFIRRFEEGVGDLVSLDHPFLVKIHNISCVDERYFLVTDVILDKEQRVTSLTRYLDEIPQKKLPEEDVYRLLCQVGAALDAAHKFKECRHVSGLQISHILVGAKDGRCSFHLSDFGLSSIMGDGLLLTRTYHILAESLGFKEGVLHTCNDAQKLLPLHDAFLETYRYFAPERKLLDEPQSQRKKIDCYAFGVLAYFLLTGKYPEGYPTLPNEQCKDYAYQWDEFIASCLSDDPNKRPEMIEEALLALKKIEITGATPHPKAEAVQKATVKDCQPALSMVSERGAGGVETLRPVLHQAELARPVVDHDPAAMFNVDPIVKRYIPEDKEVNSVEPMSTEMVIVSGGVFKRGSQDGSRDEMPRHTVNLNSFAIDVHPVTNEQFVRFLEAMGGEKDSNHQDIIRLRDSRIKRIAGKITIESGYLKHPVVGVTWYGAVAYAKWLGKRLPTEAEWEVAAQGGDEGALYPTGSEIEKSQANFFSADTTAVKSYAPNGHGIYDMAGNVYEWCSDWYDYDYYETSVQEPDNPKGPQQGVYRCLRGGCWKSLKEDVRCSRRHRNNPGTVNSTYGFRCAANAE